VGFFEVFNFFPGLVELKAMSSTSSRLVHPGKTTVRKLARCEGRQSGRAGGNTALLDAIRTAYWRLQRQADPERNQRPSSRVTDGKENASAVTLRELVQEIQQGNTDLPVVIFAVAMPGR